MNLAGYGLQEQIHGGGPPVWTGLQASLYAPIELVSGKFVHSAEFMRLALNPGGGTEAVPASATRADLTCWAPRTELGQIIGKRYY